MSDSVPSGDFEKVFTVNITTFMEFERIKVDLMKIKGVNDVSFNEEVSPHEITAFTNGLVADVILQEVIARHGFQATPKTFLIN